MAPAVTLVFLVLCVVIRVSLEPGCCAVAVDFSEDAALARDDLTDADQLERAEEPVIEVGMIGEVTMTLEVVVG